MTEYTTSPLTHCPLCGSELECSTTPGKVWCCSPECGACFVDIDPAGYVSTNEAKTEKVKKVADSSTEVGPT